MMQLQTVKWVWMGLHEKFLLPVVPRRAEKREQWRIHCPCACGYSSGKEVVGKLVEVM